MRRQCDGNASLQDGRAILLALLIAVHSPLSSGNDCHLHFRPGGESNYADTPPGVDVPTTLSYGLPVADGDPGSLRVTLSHVANPALPFFIRLVASGAEAAATPQEMCEMATPPPSTTCRAEVSFTGYNDTRGARHVTFELLFDATLPTGHYVACLDEASLPNPGSSREIAPASMISSHISPTDAEETVSVPGPLSLTALEPQVKGEVPTFNLSVAGGAGEAAVLLMPTFITGKMRSVDESCQLLDNQKFDLTFLLDSPDEMVERAFALGEMVQGDPAVTWLTVCYRAAPHLSMTHYDMKIPVLLSKERLFSSQRVLSTSGTILSEGLRAFGSPSKPNGVQEATLGISLPPYVSVPPAALEGFAAGVATWVVKSILALGNAVSLDLRDCLGEVFRGINATSAGNAWPGAPPSSPTPASAEEIPAVRFPAEPTGFLSTERRAYLVRFPQCSRSIPSLRVGGGVGGSDPLHISFAPGLEGDLHTAILRHAVVDYARLASDTAGLSEPRGAAFFHDGPFTSETLTGLYHIPLFYDTRITPPSGCTTCIQAAATTATRARIGDSIPVSLLGPGLPSLGGIRVVQLTGGTLLDTARQSLTATTSSSSSSSSSGTATPAPTASADLLSRACKGLAGSEIVGGDKVSYIAEAEWRQISLTPRAPGVFLLCWCGAGGGACGGASGEFEPIPAGSAPSSAAFFFQAVAPVITAEGLAGGPCIMGRDCTIAIKTPESDSVDFKLTPNDKFYLAHTAEVDGVKVSDWCDIPLSPGKLIGSEAGSSRYSVSLPPLGVPSKATPVTLPFESLSLEDVETGKLSFQICAVSKRPKNYLSRFLLGLYTTLPGVQVVAYQPEEFHPIQGELSLPPEFGTTRSKLLKLHIAALGLCPADGCDVSSSKPKLLQTLTPTPARLPTTPAAGPAYSCPWVFNIADKILWLVVPPDSPASGSVYSEGLVLKNVSVFLQADRGLSGWGGDPGWSHVTQTLRLLDATSSIGSTLVIRESSEIAPGQVLTLTSGGSVVISKGGSLSMGAGSTLRADGVPHPTSSVVVMPGGSLRAGSTPAVVSRKKVLKDPVLTEAATGDPCAEEGEAGVVSIQAGLTLHQGGVVDVSSGMQLDVPILWVKEADGGGSADFQQAQNSRVALASATVAAPLRFLNEKSGGDATTTTVLRGGSFNFSGGASLYAETGRFGICGASLLSLGAGVSGGADPSAQGASNNVEIHGRVSWRGSVVGFHNVSMPANDIIIHRGCSDANLLTLTNGSSWLDGAGCKLGIGVESLWAPRLEVHCEARLLTTPVDNPARHPAWDSGAPMPPDLPRMNATFSKQVTIDGGGCSGDHTPRLNFWVSFTDLLTMETGCVELTSGGFLSGVVEHSLPEESEARLILGEGLFEAGCSPGVGSCTSHLAASASLEVKQNATLNILPGASLAPLRELLVEGVLRCINHPLVLKARVYVAPTGKLEAPSGVVEGNITLAGEFDVLASERCTAPFVVKGNLVVAETVTVNCNLTLNERPVESIDLNVLDYSGVAEGKETFALSESSGCSFGGLKAELILRRDPKQLRLVLSHGNAPDTTMGYVAASITLAMGVLSVFVPIARQHSGPRSLVLEFTRVPPLSVSLTMRDLLRHHTNLWSVVQILYEMFFICASAFYLDMGYPAWQLIVGNLPHDVLAPIVAVVLAVVMVWGISWFCMRGRLIAEHAAIVGSDGTPQGGGLSGACTAHRMMSVVGQALLLPVLVLLALPVHCITVPADETTVVWIAREYECGKLGHSVILLFTSGASLMMCYLVFHSTDPVLPLLHPPLGLPADLRLKRLYEAAHIALLQVEVYAVSVLDRIDRLVPLMIALQTVHLGAIYFMNPSFYPNVTRCLVTVAWIGLSALICSETEVVVTGSDRYPCDTRERWAVLAWVASCGLILVLHLLIEVCTRHGLTSHRVADEAVLKWYKRRTDTISRLRQLGDNNSPEHSSLGIDFTQEATEMRHLLAQIAARYCLGQSYGDLTSDTRDIEMQDCDPQYAGWVRAKALGRGAFGDVYLGVLGCGALVAVKVVPLHEEGPALPIRVDEVRREVDLLRKLRHKNVIRYKDVLFDKRAKCLNIFMEYAVGGSLADIVKKSDCFLTEEIARRYIRQMLLAATHLHRNDLIHCDIRGENVLLDADGRVKLADFGCAKNVAATREALAATPYWSAPEVLQGKSFNEKVDIWSIGCTSIEVLNRGALPWRGVSEVSDAVRRITQSQDTPDNRPEGLSQECMSFIDSCFERDVDSRPPALECLTHVWVSAGFPPVESSTSSSRKDSLGVTESNPQNGAGSPEHKQSQGVYASFSVPNTTSKSGTTATTIQESVAYSAQSEGFITSN